jgi:hypothetical protein
MAGQFEGTSYRENRGRTSERSAQLLRDKKACLANTAGSAILAYLIDRKATCSPRRNGHWCITRAELPLPESLVGDLKNAPVSISCKAKLYTPKRHTNPHLAHT